jgi:SpoIVB peptidase S55
MSSPSRALIFLATGIVFGILAASERIAMKAATSMMPVSEIKTGMVGTGQTVFNGTRVEEFKVRVLGVIANVMGPQRNLVLARLEGGPLAQTGVIAGMSGSPVYIDGRLIGAVSYALGNFSKEPIAGITPIDEMTAEATAAPMRPASARLQVDFPLTPEDLTSSFRRALGWNRPFAERVGDARFTGLSGVTGLTGAEVGTLLRPIATPLVMSGFSPDVADLLTSAFRDHGFLPTTAGGAGANVEMNFEGPLKPGDAVGVNFVAGDFLLGGTGTVTHVDGDKVYAFGHPMYNLGPTEFPMTRAYVYTVLPSLAASTKLTTTGEVIGTFLHDRPTMIGGRLGPGPKMIPVTVRLRSDHAPARTFSFQVVKDQLFTPLMTQTMLVNLFLSYERQFGAATFGVKGTVDTATHGRVSIENVFAGQGASNQAAAAVAIPLALLVTNDYEKVELDKLDVTIDSSEEPKTATLERAWIDDPRPRAGRTVPLKLLLRPHRGDEFVRTVSIEIPSNARGNLSLVVSDGTRLAQAEQAELRQAAAPRTVPQLVRVLNQARRGDTLYIRLVSRDAGAIVRGERLASLPPSVLEVVESDRSSGGTGPLGSATLGEWTLATGQAVTGSRTLSMSLSSN